MKKCLQHFLMILLISKNMKIAYIIKKYEMMMVTIEYDVHNTLRGEMFPVYLNDISLFQT